MCRIKTVGFTSALWVIYARCNGSLVVCSSMQASRFQIPGSPVQKKARDEGSGHGSPLGSPRAFPGSANFTIRNVRFSSFTNPGLHLSQNPDYALINAKKLALLT